jgi:hypothetical protein
VDEEPVVVNVNAASVAPTLACVGVKPAAMVTGYVPADVMVVAVALPSEGAVNTGLPVQLLRSPLVGVPNAGVIKTAFVNVGEVNINESVICRVTSLCTTGNISVLAAVVAMGSSVIAISLILYP